MRKLTPPPDFTSLLALYIMGEDLVDRAFAQAVMDALIVNLKTFPYRSPDPKTLFLAYDLTSPQSPLRKLLVDICVWRSDDLRKDDLEGMPSKLKDELLIKLVEKLNEHDALLHDPEPWKARPAQYKVAQDPESTSVTNSQPSAATVSADEPTSSPATTSVLTPSVLITQSVPTTPSVRPSLHKPDHPTHSIDQSQSPERIDVTQTEEEPSGKMEEEVDRKSFHAERSDTLA
jgi:hypothetical protein